MAAKLAFIGCGAMGAPIVERLIDVGYDVRIYDPSAAATAPLVERGAAREAATGAEIAFACLPSPDISRAVALGPDGIAGRKGLAVYIEMSTVGSRNAKDRRRIEQGRHRHARLAGPARARAARRRCRPRRRVIAPLSTRQSRFSKLSRAMCFMSAIRARSDYQARQQHDFGRRNGGSL